jgi:dihydropteroate synthase
MPQTPRKTFRWKLRRRTLALGQQTLLMSIVNLTPDSFSGDGLSALAVNDRVRTAVQRWDEGADLLDVGAESTRPDALPITGAIEQKRLLPVLEGVLKQRPEAVISVDTYHASTARLALAAGAEIVNDVSGLMWDPEMAAVVADSGCGLVLMHSRGRSAEWSSLPLLGPEEVVPLVRSGLQARLELAHNAGIAREGIVLDPGFGFGIRGAVNFTLLARLRELGALDMPLLVGLSRKGFLGEVVRPWQSADLPEPLARLTATVAANVAAILKGAHVLRVHDLQAAREAAAIADAVLLAE